MRQASGTADDTTGTASPGLVALSRRELIAGGAAVVLSARAAAASSDYVDDGEPDKAIEHIAAGRQIKEGRVTVRLPELAENGNVVALTVDVDSPMSPSDYVRTVHVIAGKNPLATIARFHFSPRSGRARVQANIRLATTQVVTVLAEMSDGSVWSGTAPVLVTLSACLDGG